MNRFLIWPTVLLLPVSIYGVVRLLPSQESIGRAVVLALMMDVFLVMFGAVLWRKRMERFSDSLLAIMIGLAYFAVPSLWIVLGINALAPSEAKIQSYEVIEKRRATGSDHAYLFLWTGNGIRRQKVGKDEDGALALPGDTVVLGFKTGLVGLKTMSDVRIRK